jgi:PAS domain S-box-containing protein
MKENKTIVQEESHKSYTILLVEDDAIDHMAFKRLVKEENLPYNYHIATLISEAKKLIETIAFDVIITDYSLGDGTAFDLLPLVKDVPVIIVTGTGDEDTAVRALRAGAYDYLIKDADRYYLRVLPQTVENAVARFQTEKQNKLLSYALMGISEAVCITDGQGKILYVNQAFSQMYGYMPQEIMGKPFFFIWENEKEAEKSLSKESVVLKGEFAHKTRDGKTFLVFLSRSFVKSNGNESALVFVIRDISQEKEAKLNLAKKAEELARSNADLEQFAYVASHDLQEPLRLLARGLDLLLKRYQHLLDPEVNEFVVRSIEGVNRLQRLVNDLLAYSRIGWQAKEFVEVNMEQILDRALFNLKMSAWEKDAVITHDPLPVVKGDEIQLLQLFQNLIGNALKFHGEKPPKVHVWTEKKGKEWVFAVQDNGIGIDMKQADNIFKIFNRGNASEKIQGTGIGLAICKRIVERHGGRIWVESHPGKGSTFYFTIPS